MSRKNSPITSVKQLKGIAAHFLLCPVIYLGILWFLKSTGSLEAQNPEVLPMMTGILAMVFVFQIGFAYFFPRLMSRSATSKDVFENYRNVVIVQLALLETGAIFGLVLGFMGAEMIVSICFSLASVFFILNNFPSEAKMERFARH